MTTLLKRLLYILPVIWLVVSMVFLLIHLVPGDPEASVTRAWHLLGWTALMEGRYGDAKRWLDQAAAMSRSRFSSFS